MKNRIFISNALMLLVTLAAPRPDMTFGTFPILAGAVGVALVLGIQKLKEL